MSTSPLAPTKIDLQIDVKQLLGLKHQKPFWLNDQSVFIDQGLVVDIQASNLPKPKYQAQQKIQLNNHSLMPAFANNHCALGSSLFHHLELELPFSFRLQNHLKPLEQKWLSKELIEIATLFSLSQTLQNGTAFVNSHYYHPEISAKIINELQGKAQFGVYLDATAETSIEQQLAQALKLRDDFKHQTSINFSLSLPELNSLSDKVLNKVSAISNELGLAVQLALKSDPASIKSSLSQYGLRPLERLNQVGLVSPELAILDAQFFQRKELELIAKAGCQLIVSPLSNLRQGQSLPSISEFLNLDGQLLLGTNNYHSASFDLLKSLELTTLMTKFTQQSASAIDPQTTLSMAFNSASSEAANIKAIQIGQAADLCAIKLDRINSGVNYDPFQQIVYTANQQDISHLWIDGHCQLQDGNLCNIDQVYLQKHLRQWQQKLYD